MPRRERWTIYGAILQSIDEHQRAAGPDARVTHVAMRANVPYDRLMTYLDELAGAGLVTRDRMPQITSEGRVFLEHYVRWKEILGRYGLG